MLVRDDAGKPWTGDLFLRKISTTQGNEGIFSKWFQCVPYEGNEHLLLTKDMPDEYYITWEEEK